MSEHVLPNILLENFNEANLFLNADTETTLADNIMGAYHASS